MQKFSCFRALSGRKNKNKGDKSPPAKIDDYQNKLKILQLRLKGPVDSSGTDELKSNSFSVPVPFGKVKVMNHESPVKGEAAEVAYEGEDEHEENLSMKRDNSGFDFHAPKRENSDFDFQAHIKPNEENEQSIKTTMEFYGSFGGKSETSCQLEKESEKDADERVDLIPSGHVSDPGMGKAEFWASPNLKRSCSNLERSDALKKIADQLAPSKSHSFEELQKLAERFKGEVLPDNPCSPRSVATHHSADKVMLKKHSSSQILPSGSRRLWWKLFLWSHRNLHTVRFAKPQKLPVKPPFNQQGGYCSDTLEPNRASSESKMESPGSFKNNCNTSWDGFHGGVSGFWPQNQWIAFSTDSPLSRVDEWVKELATQPPPPVDDDDDNDVGINFPPSPETGRSPARSTSLMSRRPNLNLSEEILHANGVIQSLNSSSTVAHITGIGLKVIPTLSQFVSLRSVNLSGNSIVHLTPGSLPKGLHTLNLSKNNISTIEGLRELTRLRVLDLSYNRISRIGQGLSNCTLIKELYLAGNKISEVEGLHRLLKLSVLDLSFNKITTTKSLGQLVANYHSLLALNLVGNPIQNNVSDDQLRKAVCGLLPKLAYLNKQPINTQKAREVAAESVTRAALGSNNWSSRRKTMRRASQSGSSSSGAHHRISSSIGQRSRHGSRSRGAHRPSGLKMNSADLPSSSR
ncbi:hypothetical protein NMG60_11031404 [Bertholletia excelsa]